MKIRNPSSKYELEIRRKDLVLDVGSGHNPHKRADVLLERYPDDETHRCGPVKVPPGKKFVTYNSGRFPFEDNEFDYVTCIHVLEHVDKPDLFLQELARVAPKGYIEIPSLIGEFLIPKESHKWVVLEIEEEIVFMEKRNIPFKPFWGDMFQKHVSPNSIEFRIFQESLKDLFTVRYEWQDNVDYLINPREEHYKKYFFQNWTDDMIKEFIPKRTKKQQLSIFLSKFVKLLKEYILRSSR